MRLFTRLTAGLLLTTSAVAAFSQTPTSQRPATHRQTVQREDIVGTWLGDVEFPYAPFARKGPQWLAFWADGLWFYHDDVKHMVKIEGRPPATTAPDSQFANNHGHGRWRLSGDTLWVGDDTRYSHGALMDSPGRLGKTNGESVDTMSMPNYPKNDSLFWSRDVKRTASNSPGWRDGMIHRIMAYKVSIVNGDLVLRRIDDLSDDLYANARGVYERQDVPIPPVFP